VMTVETMVTMITTRTNWFFRHNIVIE
jgi:hypothetical protein